MTGMEENQPEQLGNQQEMLLFGIEGIEILSFLYNDEIDSTQFTLLISRVLSSNLPLFMHLLGRQFSIWLQFQETATLALKYIAEQLSPTDSESLNRYFIDCPNLDERVLIFIANALQRGEPNNRAGFCPIGKLKNDTAASEYFPFNIVFLVVTYTEIKGLNIPINQISTIYNQMQLSLCRYKKFEYVVAKSIELLIVEFAKSYLTRQVTDTTLDIKASVWDAFIVICTKHPL